MTPTIHNNAPSTPDDLPESAEHDFFGKDVFGASDASGKIAKHTSFEALEAVEQREVSDDDPQHTIKALQEKKVLPESPNTDVLVAALRFFKDLGFRLKIGRQTLGTGSKAEIPLSTSALQEALMAGGKLIAPLIPFMASGTAMARELPDNVPLSELMKQTKATLDANPDLTQQVQEATNVAVSSSGTYFHLILAGEIITIAALIAAILIIKLRRRHKNRPQLTTPPSTPPKDKKSLMESLSLDFDKINGPFLEKMLKGRIGAAVLKTIGRTFIYTPKKFGPLTPEKVETLIGALNTRKRLGNVFEIDQIVIESDSIDVESAKALAKLVPANVGLALDLQTITPEIAEELANSNSYNLAVGLPDGTVVDNDTVKKLASQLEGSRIFIGDDQ